MALNGRTLAVFGRASVVLWGQAGPDGRADLTISQGSHPDPDVSLLGTVSQSGAGAWSLLVAGGRVPWPGRRASLVLPEAAAQMYLCEWGMYLLLPR